MPTGRPLRFIATQSVRLNGSGYGYCTVTCPSNVDWAVEVTSVSTATTTPTATQPLCSVYADSSPNPTKLMQSTYSGNRDASDSQYTVLGSESVTAEWTGGPANTLATLRLTGMQRQAY